MNFTLDLPAYVVIFGAALAILGALALYGFAVLIGAGIGLFMDWITGRLGKSDGE